MFDLGSVLTQEDDLESVYSLEEKSLEKSPEKDWGAAANYQDPVQEIKKWPNAKDEVEKQAGLKPFCAHCKVGTPTLKHSVLLPLLRKP